MASKRQAEKALELFEERLSSLPNVVGLGIVKSGDGDAVAVYVTKKLPKAELEPEDMVPETLEIPQRGRSKTTKVPTKVIEQGEVSLEPGG